MKNLLTLAFLLILLCGNAQYQEPYVKLITGEEIPCSVVKFTMFGGNIKCKPTEGGGNWQKYSSSNVSSALVKGSSVWSNQSIQKYYIGITHAHAFGKHTTTITGKRRPFDIIISNGTDHLLSRTSSSSSPGTGGSAMGGPSNTKTVSELFLVTGDQVEYLSMKTLKSDEFKAKILELFGSCECVNESLFDSKIIATKYLTELSKCYYSHESCFKRL